MFSRLIGLILFLIFSYILLVFVLPDIADQYWDKDINTKIRNIKNTSLQFASGSHSTGSLFTTIHSTVMPLVDETQKTVQQINTTITTKVQQVQETSNAIQSAYSGVIDAKNKIESLAQ